MRRRLYLVYPALLAVIPILYRQAQNPGPTLDDALGFSLVVAGMVVLVQGVCYALLRSTMRRLPDELGDRAALLAMFAVIVFYEAANLADWAHSTLPQHPQLAVLVGVVGLAAALAALWWGTRRGGARRIAPFLAPFGRFVALAAVLLAGWSTAQVLYAPVQASRVARSSKFIKDLARPIAVTRPTPAGEQRDVYVLVLDEYPAASVLHETYGIDNTPFIDSLRALGFHTPARPRSNYAITVMSVPSLLNFAQMQQLAVGLPRGYLDYRLGTYTLDNNRAARFLKARGYQFVFFPSAWFAPTRHNAQADEELPLLRGVDIGRTLHRSLLIQSFVEQTAIRPLLRYLPTPQESRWRFIEGTLAAVSGLAARPPGGRPVFAVAHVLAPHDPYIVDAACHPYPRGTLLVNDNPAASPAVRAGLAAELTCLNRHVLATVRAILARPGPRPIVILQGDHGTQGLNLFDTAPDSIRPAQVQERFSPLAAYYLPDGGAAAMGDTVSIVNVFRAVFRYYYDADLPPITNAMYYSNVHTPYTLTPIDTLTLRPVLRPAPGKR